MFQNDCAVNIESLNFAFEQEEILNNINLKIEKGKFYSILGPNGSGKTTLIKNVCKILSSKYGNIYVDNKGIRRLGSREMAKEMALVPQNTTVEFDFSVLDIVLMGRTPYISRFSTESEEDLRIVQAAMEATNIWHLRHKSINSLSGGERQRVIVARAITQETDIILLDEPISSLDIYHQVEILNTIKKLNLKKNITIIAVLHDLNLAAAYSDPIIMMHKGRVYSQGTPEEILM
ncbi:ABC transporter ATP-binding protein [Clostridium sp.]|uniref:ABC transporter ATP-binding protein n=1 Tax=Clostridium sp. TaxID=1506 RepID=UPI00321701FE